MKVKFWGVRGSIPCPGPSTVKYGGNTTSLELRFGEQERLIMIDAGSGIRGLGNHIMANDFKKGPIKTEIFFTHTHWDHIMGFPFFVPIFIPTTEITVYGPVTYENETLGNIIGGQLRYRYFPIRQSELSANIEYIHLKERDMDLGDGITLRTKYLNHPILCLGYRFEHEGKSICTCFDTEPFRNVFATDPESDDYDAVAVEEGEKVVQEENNKLIEFIKGADVVIYDAQYTHSEYIASKLGWGHSTFEQAINTAHKAGVKKLVFFHHDPMRTDRQIDSILGRLKEIIKDKTPLQIDAAREGMEIVI